MNDDLLLNEIEEALFDAVERAKAYRYTGEGHKIRQGYYTSLATLLNSYIRYKESLNEKDFEERLEVLEEELLNGQ
jgi:hypothetical protein